MATPDAAAALVTSRTNPSNSSTPASPYCAHRCEGSRCTVRPDEHELHLVADQRLDSGIGQPRLNPAQRTAGAVGIRRTVLSEERAWRPGQSVAEDAQRAEVDADSLIPHHPGAVAEHDAGLVDGEDMPDRAGAEPRIGERTHPPQRDGLGVSEARRVDDGADQCGDAVGFELGDRLRRREVWRPCQSFCREAVGDLQGDLAGLPDVERAQHPAHADPHRTGDRQIGHQLVVECAGPRAPRSPRRRAVRCGRWRIGVRTPSRCARRRCSRARSAIPRRGRRTPRRRRWPPPRRRGCSDRPRIRWRTRS